MQTNTPMDRVQTVAVITVSDTCFVTPSKDKSGPSLASNLENLFPDACIHTSIVPDEQKQIEDKLKYYSDDLKAQLILTTGGTGLSARDVTPEATKSVIHREVPSIPLAIAIDSLDRTPMAMLSRAIAGVRNSTLIINLPGSVKAVEECFEVIVPILTHAISLINNDLTEVRATHDKMQRKKSSVVDVNKVALRARESPFPMLPMDEAFKIVDQVMATWQGGEELILIDDALGRVVTERLSAKEPMSPFPASVKDGYACLSADGAGVRKVRAALTAGDEPATPLQSGECARINTGAALPSNADCVVQVEDTALVSASEDGSVELEIEIKVAPQPNQDVRPIGVDIPKGYALAEKGDILNAALIGVLAGAGHQYVKVTCKPKVALLSTGNELQEVSEEILKPAHIRDSNRTMLKCLLREHGFESIDCGIAIDEPNILSDSIQQALSKADILICTGGVSMGERDLLKPVLQAAFGATLHFGRVKMKPGKPTTFATCEVQGRKKFVFALPGNPVSAYVCCLLFVVRALRVCCSQEPHFKEMRVRITHEVTLDPRPEYARATLDFPKTDDIPLATCIGNQNSSRLLSACGASVLLQLPGATDDLKRLAAGTTVNALILKM